MHILTKINSHTSCYSIHSNNIKTDKGEKKKEEKRRIRRRREEKEKKKKEEGEEKFKKDQRYELLWVYMDFYGWG